MRVGGGQKNFKKSESFFWTRQAVVLGWGQMKTPNNTAARFQVQIIRDIVGTSYCVIDSSKPSFANGHSNSLGIWTSLKDAQEVSDRANS
jgi:hypothetical protein